MVEIMLKQIADIPKICRNKDDEMSKQERVLAYIIVEFVVLTHKQTDIYSGVLC